MAITTSERVCKETHSPITVVIKISPSSTSEGCDPLFCCSELVVPVSFLFSALRELSISVSIFDVVNSPHISLENDVFHIVTLLSADIPKKLQQQFISKTRSLPSIFKIFGYKLFGFLFSELNLFYFSASRFRSHCLIFGGYYGENRALSY